jgi:hypothetical protein
MLILVLNTLKNLYITDTCGQCYKTFFSVITPLLAWSMVISLRHHADIGVNYTLKGFLALTTVGNVMQLFSCIYANIDIA